MRLSVILLAGGKGTRMGTPIPKVFLPLKGKPIVLHSFELFQSFEKVTEIIVVCPPNYQYLFPSNTLFALPGNTRQDSVKNGFKKTTSPHILIHDGARPFIPQQSVETLIDVGCTFGAAALGIPMTSTVKEVNTDLTVTKTLSRSSLYTIQTPQFLKREILEQGLQAATSQNLNLTDDVALAELINHPVKIVLGSPLNIKITHLEDLHLAESI